MDISHWQLSQIWIYRRSVGMRKSADGLCAIVRQAMNIDANDDKVFVFCHRARDIAILLVWHRNGFWLLYCNDHARRQFMDIVKSIGKDHDVNNIIATRAVAWYKPLHALAKIKSTSGPRRNTSSASNTQYRTGSSFWHGQNNSNMTVLLNEAAKAQSVEDFERLLPWAIPPERVRELFRTYPAP